MTASNIIKSIRNKHGYTQDDMAKKLNITRQCYNNLENNPTKANLDKIYDIFRLLDEKIDDFLVALKQDYMSQNKTENQEE